MEIKIRRTAVISLEQHEEAGQRTNRPQRKVATIAVVGNPYAGRYVENLQPIIDASAHLGAEMAAMAVAAFGADAVQSYGKGGLVGLAGEQEHANAMLTTVFADPFRKAIGGGIAWISSVTKVGAPGAPIDIPMNHKDEISVRSHYDVMSIALPGTPMPDEIAIIFCLANRGRLNARVGGPTHEAAMAKLGRRGAGT
jgi:hypothetical protein